jgi:O-antigen ligase
MDTPAMQTLVQGQGIIDIVNAYLRIALDSGLIGLSLYLGAVGFAVLAALRAIGPARRVSEELSSYCQSYFAALLGISVVLATTANTIAQIQEMTWVLAGMCVGLARSVALARREQDATPAIEQTATVVAPEPEPAPLDPTPPSRPLPPHLRQYAKR